MLVYPGGTLLELAVYQGKGEAFVERVAELGFTAVEISEGTIELDTATRKRLIMQGVSCGLTVLSEVGKRTAPCLRRGAPQKPSLPISTRVPRGSSLKRRLGAGWGIR